MCPSKIQRCDAAPVESSPVGAKGSCCNQIDATELSCCDKKIPDPSPSTSKCCSSRSPLNLTSTTISECCSTEEKHQLTAEDKSCDVCEQTAGQDGSSCCDESCIERIAARECLQECCDMKRGRPDVHHTKPSEAGQSTTPPSHTTSPCDEHMRSSRKRFRPTLEAVGCICRALLALNLESCCATSQPSNQVKKPQKRPESPAATSVSSIQPSRTCNGTPRRRYPKEGRCETKKDRGDQLLRDTCCGGKGDGKLNSNPGGCCKPPGDSGTSQEHQPAVKYLSRQLKNDSPPADLENGPSTEENVILSVQGMTCSGCETKLSKFLSELGGVSDLKSSLILSRAEFKLDTRRMSVEDVIAYLKRTTGFDCSRMAESGHELDITVSDPTAFSAQKWPDGVTDVKLVGPGLARIRYDATLVGARDLLEGDLGSYAELAPQRLDPTIAAGRDHVRKTGIMTLISVCLTIPVLVFEWAPLSNHELIYNSLSLALATLVQVFIAGPFYLPAIKALVLAGLVEMDLVIVLSTTAAYVFSVVSFALSLHGTVLSTGEFFETSTLLVTLIMLGRLLSAWARAQAVESITIRSLQQQTAFLVEGHGQRPREIDARLLQYGDIFRVMPDTCIVTDGTVVSGSSEVDESMISGEALPVEKTTSSTVVAGTVNLSGVLDVRVSQLLSENSISNIANMVDAAKLSKPKTQELADKVVRYFVPAVLLITIITFVSWIAVGIHSQHKSGSDAAVDATTYAIAALIVSCPCAIGLAVPMVILIAGGIASEKGVVFKTATAMEHGRSINHVVFDKTGTLTTGIFTVISEEYLGQPRGDTEAILLGLVADVKHPVSAALARVLKERGVIAKEVENIKSIPGKGIEGTIEGVTIRGGNARWLGIELPTKDLRAGGLTIFAMVLNETLVAVFGLQDTLRPESRNVVSALRRRGAIVSILSGDDDGVVQNVAEQLSIPPTLVRSRCSPEDKKNYIEQVRGQERARIMFVGDGTNDAVALAAADIGVHLNHGTDVALSAADVVLVRPKLTGVLFMMDLSRAVFRRIVFNFCWAGVYNVVAILFAAGCFGRVRIPPAYAALGELCSVLPVIAVALQMKWSSVQG